MSPRSPSGWSGSSSSPNPGVGDDDRRYVDRLVTALRPTFEARTAQDSTGQDSTGQDSTGQDGTGES